MISRTAGAEGIVAIAVGQSVGAVAGIAVALGWPLVGPALVARSNQADRRNSYRQSLGSRLVVLALLAPPAFVLSFVLVSGYRLAAGLAGLAFAGYGLTATWFYTGSADGKGLVLFETIPRVIATAIAGTAIAFGAPLTVYPVLLIAAVIATFYLNSIRVLGTVRLRIRRSSLRIRAELPATVSRLLQGGYSMGSVLIVAALSPTAALPFVAYSRVLQPALGATAAYSQALMAWVAGDQKNLVHRQCAGLVTDFFFSISAGVAVYAALPSIMHFLFDDLIVATYALSLATALGVVFGTFSYCTLQHGLLAAGDDRFATRLLGVQSVCSLGAMTALVVSFGALGAMVVFAAGEFVFSMAALIRLVVVRRRDV
ncbi:MAG: hypothetical protein M3R63_05470 [Actinomycetota bacterium]|nr:hypothetical protein [Actinomycetota bacterium]